MEWSPLRLGRFISDKGEREIFPCPRRESMQRE